MEIPKQDFVDAAQWMTVPLTELPDYLKVADVDFSSTIDTPTEFGLLYDEIMAGSAGSRGVKTVAQSMRQILVETPEPLADRRLRDVGELKPVWRGLGQIVRMAGVSAGTKAIQEALNEISASLSDYPKCEVGPADGMFGARTEGAVKAFQAVQSGLVVTGQVDRSTLHQLDEILNLGRTIEVNAVHPAEDASAASTGGGTADPKDPSMGPPRVDSGSSHGAKDSSSPTVPPPLRMITYGDRFGNDCALTFDDGPDPDTSTVLDVLNAHGVQGATFFVQGINVKRYPAILKRIVDEGHVLGNHTYDHPDLRKLTVQEIQLQLQQCQDAVNDALGREYSMTQMRPPYGAFNEHVKAVLQAQNLALLLWQIDTNDWRVENRRNTQNIVANVFSGSAPVTGGRGGLILFHDIHSSTGEILPTIVSQLKREGLSITTAEALLSQKYADRP